MSVFTLNILALLSKEEDKFLIFKSKSIYEKIIKLFNVQSNSCNPSLKLGYIAILSAFLNHYNGLEYVVSTNYWHDALKYCLSNQTVYIIKEGREFLYNLLEKTKDNNAFANMLVQEVLSVLSKNHFQNGTSFPEIKEEQLRLAIGPTLELISFILEAHFRSANFVEKVNQIPILFLKSHDLEKTIWQMILMVHNAELLLQLEKIMIMIYFLDMHIKCAESVYPKDQILVAVGSVFQMIRTHLSKREIGSIIQLCYSIHYFWQFIQPHCLAPGEPIPQVRFENQILIMQMMPIFCIGHKYCLGHFSEMLDDFRENFITKLFKIMCESTIRMCYTWRSIILEEDVILDHAQTAIHYLQKSRIYFDRDTAVICFQAILYGVKDMAFVVSNFANKITVESNKFSVYVTNLIDAVILFIENYDFTWRDSIETICIMTSCLDILKYSKWSYKVSSDKYVQYAV